jgi:O-antigen/teichoic acid export membrane protein
MSDIANLPPRDLLASRLLARNILWNLMGTAGPLVVALFAVPILIARLGTDRFGILTLAWVAIGYFSFFDLGIGRALTKLVAEKLGANRHEDVTTLIWTSLLVMFCLGCIGTLLTIFPIPWLVHSVLRVPAAMQRETVLAFYVLCVALPIVITSTGLRGILEAYQHFRAVCALRVLLGVLTFGAPLVVLPFSHSLFPVAMALALGRFIVLVVNFVLCVTKIPEMRQRIHVNQSCIGSLVRFGMWMTVSNVIGPLLAYMDRFLIGAMVSVAAVAYYATPSELVTKSLLIPIAMTGVLFPAFSTSFVHDPNSTLKLFERGTKCVFLALFPITLIIVTFAHAGLVLWLGMDFANNSSRVLQWLAAGVFMNGLAQVPYAQIQAAGRPDLTAKLHMAELSIYILLLWWSVASHGIVGAAIAWTARATVDSVCLFLIARNLLPRSKTSVARSLLGLSACGTLLLLGAVLPTIGWKALFIVVMLAGFGLGSWFVVLTPEEKSFLWGWKRILLTAQ